MQITSAVCVLCSTGLLAILGFPDPQASQALPPVPQAHPTVIPLWEQEEVKPLIHSALFLVMDITDIIKGKAESDEEKQHFIPFHP